MSATTGSCSCGCSPCACPSPTGFGCIGDMCVPRPCFFNGQLVTSDDLNAAVTYARTREAMLARFVGGWGVLGGLRVDKAPGIQSVRLTAEIPAALSPNPQLLAGTTIQVSPGVATDASGRALAVCAPRILDVAQLMAEAPTAPRTQTCTTWFAPINACGEQGDNNLTASEYWLVAEYVETPSRPVPQFAGGGACDPAPGCDYSRKIEGVRFRLVPALPQLYFLTGCLDDIAPPAGFPPDFLPGNGSSHQSTSSNNNNNITGRTNTVINTTDSTTTTTTSTDDNGGCIYGDYLIFEALMQIVANACCSQPAVVLARLIVTSSPGSLQGGLPTVPLYTFLLDGYPFRRVIVPASVLTYLSAQTICAVESLTAQLYQSTNQTSQGSQLRRFIGGLR